jgi:hypothetical protein
MDEKSYFYLFIEELPEPADNKIHTLAVPNGRIPFDVSFQDSLL